jgi:thioredoxin reductase (NADPH)
LAPNAGEVTQGYALGMKLGAKKSDFDDLIGIHPTVAEVFYVVPFLTSKSIFFLSF